MSDHHTLTVQIEDGSFSPVFHCPHEGKTFTLAEAPFCRWYHDRGEDRVTDTCLAKDAFDAYGVDCVDVDGPRGASFTVTQYPIPVTYRWDGEDFYVSPVAVEATASGVSR